MRELRVYGKASFELEAEVGLNGKGPQWLARPQFFKASR